MPECANPNESQGGMLPNQHKERQQPLIAETSRHKPRYLFPESGAFTRTMVRLVSRSTRLAVSSLFQTLENRSDLNSGVWEILSLRFTPHCNLKLLGRFRPVVFGCKKGKPCGLPYSSVCRIVADAPERVPPVFQAAVSSKPPYRCSEVLASALGGHAGRVTLPSASARWWAFAAPTAILSFYLCSVPFSVSEW